MTQSTSNTSNPRLINTVIFDLGNVLVGVDETQATRQVAELTGLSQDAAGAAFMACLPTMKAYEMGQMNVVEFYHRLRNVLGMDGASYSFPYFKETFCSVIRPLPEMERLFFDCLAVCTTCVLSNTNDLHWTWTAEQFEFLPAAHHTLTSYQCGLYKPQPEIYQLALRRFGVQDPSRALFIDDRPENVEGAVAVGMTASFVHQDSASTRQRLEALGVLQDRRL